MPNIFHVEAHWDPEAKVWTSSSDIPGLVIETDTLAEFEQLVHALAPELLADNSDVTGPVGVELEFKGRFQLAVA